MANLRYPAGPAAAVTAGVVTAASSSQFQLEIFTDSFSVAKELEKRPQKVDWRGPRRPVPQESG